MRHWPHVMSMTKIFKGGSFFHITEILNINREKL